MPSATIQTTASISSAGAAAKSLTFPLIAVPNAVGTPQMLTIPAGNVTVTPPAGTTLIIAAIPAFTGTLTLKGVAADTGIVMLTNPPMPSVVSFPLAQASFVLNSTVSIPGTEVWYI
jgi:hypothetical protein